MLAFLLPTLWSPPQLFYIWWQPKYLQSPNLYVSFLFCSFSPPSPSTFLKTMEGTSLTVQRLGLPASTARGRGLILVGELRSHKLWGMPPQRQCNTVKSSKEFSGSWFLPTNLSPCMLGIYEYSKAWPTNHVLWHEPVGFCTCCCCSVAQSCPTLCDPMVCSPPGSSVSTTSQSPPLSPRGYSNSCPWRWWCR